MYRICTSQKFFKDFYHFSLHNNRRRYYKKNSYNLKKGKTAKIKVKTIKQNKRKKLLGPGHCAKLRYVSSDTKVATVNKGKIKAEGTGTCKIWIYAQNGRRREVTVAVK